MTDSGASSDHAEDMSRDDYVIRSIVAQAILAEVAGSTKFTVGRTPTR